MNTSTNSSVSDHSGVPADVARQAYQEQMPWIKQALTELVSFPSVHDYPGLEEGNAQACQWVVGQFSDLDIDVHAHKTVDGSSSVLGYREPAEGYPTVALYSHFDVQPAADTENWTSDPWTLTARDGRWYGRGAADCKGNVVMHLGALRAARALEADYPELSKVGLRIIVEGSEERGSEGLETLLADKPELFAADQILIADSGNLAVGVPSIGTALRGSAPVTVTLETLDTPVHSGLFGGPAPDALLAMVQLLGTLHDAHGLVAVPGLASDAHWEGVDYPAADFRKDAEILDGVDIIGQAQGIAINDLLVARPALTVTALDAVPVKDAINAVPARSSAVLNLRVPPGMDPKDAQDLLVDHLEKNVPWGAHMSIERNCLGNPFSADLSGEAYKVFEGALKDSYGAEVQQAASGGSIPLCANLLKEFPDAELLLFGVEEPLCKIHAANESVDPSEIEHTGIAELLFLSRISGAQS